MPAGKRQQSNTMLYTVITFVGLFIVAATVAVIYYVKFEDQRTIAARSQEELGKLLTSAEQRKGLGKIVGTIPRGKSGMGTMADYLDQTVSLIIGSPLEDTSAEVKVDTANRETKNTLELLAQKYPETASIDPNSTGLVRVMEKGMTTMDNITNTMNTLQRSFKELQNRFDDAMAVNSEKEKTLLAEKEKYQQRVNDIAQDYNKLKALLEQTSEQQVQNLMTQLDEEKANRKKLNQRLLKTEAQLKIAEDKMARIQDEFRKLMPVPDPETPAYKSDGKILLIDEHAKIVHLNLGSDDRVYRGLTFSVYEKNMPIPKDGKGKAEIEVSNVGKNIAAARIVRSERRNPIVLEDNIANLIWDSKKTNVFVIAGDFDLNDDGQTDYQADEKIKELIEKWGGMTVNSVSIETDFVVLGSPPEVLRKPSFEQMEIDPMAMEKYEASLKKLKHYNEVQEQAQGLSIPIFNAERFLYLIGYKTLAARPGAF